MCLGPSGKYLGIEHWVSASADLGFTWELVELPMLGAFISFAGDAPGHQTLRMVLTADGRMESPVI